MAVAAAMCRQGDCPAQATDQIILHISRTELTEPYQQLLAKSLVADATNEVELIRRATVQAEGGSDGPPSGLGYSIFVKLAGIGGQPSNTLEGSSFDQTAGRSGQFANLQAKLDALVKLLMEPAGRQARRQAAGAIRQP